MYCIEIVDRIVVVSAYVSGPSLVACSLSEMPYILFKEQTIEINISAKVEASLTTDDLVLFLFGP